MSGFSFSGLIRVVSFLSFPTSWRRVGKEEERLGRVGKEEERLLQSRCFLLLLMGKAVRPLAASGDNEEMNVSVAL